LKRLLILALLCSPCWATTPTLYFTDLISGPVGSIVTVYGVNLTPAATVNGVSATIVLSSATKVSLTVPSLSAGTYNIQVGGAGNTLPFTVRSGNIYYVSTSGNDSTGNGSFSTPWATIPHGYHTATCGDIVYVENGVTQTATDNYDASLAVATNCASTTPQAVIAYPGATVTIGSSSGAEYGIRNPDTGPAFSGQVFAGMNILGSNNGILVNNSSYWRIIGNTFSCPTGSGEAACVQTEVSTYIEILGNTVTNTGAGGTKYYHSIYLTTNSTNIEVGWNSVYNVNTCRGIQFNSTSGSAQFNESVHDNIITGTECDGINFATVDGSLGYLNVYNNLVYHIGLGGTTDGLSNYACFASLGYTTGTGSILVYGNTFADCGSYGGTTAGAITVQTSSPQVLLTSNLIMQNSGEVVYSSTNQSSLITLSSNVIPTPGTNYSTYVNSSTYKLVSGSPAIGAGTASSGILYDLAGNPRPQSGAEDAGAYLYNFASSTTTAQTGGSAQIGGSASMQ
jgi:hypothetical protein